MHHPIESLDRDVLQDVLRRAELIEELRDGPLDRRDIEERLAVSRATSHRYTRLLESMGVVEKSDSVFGLTESGHLLADALVRFERTAITALKLAPILEAVHQAPVDIDAAAFEDATVSSTAKGDPYGPLRRFVTLLDGQEQLRAVDTGDIAPLYLDEIYDCIREGMATEVICRPAVVAELLSAHPDKYQEACASGWLEIAIHDDLEFSLFMLDGRVAVAVRTGTDGSSTVMADTTNRSVRAWAREVFDAYRTDAVPVEEYTPSGYRQAENRLRRPR